jgi:succinate-semialdehyde dehydrogenase/glutarate-semialdehyde dehydrogenase
LCNWAKELNSKKNQESYSLDRAKMSLPEHLTGFTNIQKMKGIPATVNRGVEKATGEWFSMSSWICGKERKGGETMLIRDPSTEECFAEVSIADEFLVAEALEGAQRALNGWRNRSAKERAGLLRSLAEMVRGHNMELSHLLTREVGKPAEAASAEVESAASLIEYFAEEGLRLAGTIPLQGHHREQVLVVREPIGVVAAIASFNYPLSILAAKAAPALAAGCTVVAKPDEHTPLATLRLARLASEAGLPDGVFSVVAGPGPQTGHALAVHPIPRLIAFTGSSAVGKQIQRLSADHVKRVVLEMGGHCPAIVCEDSDWKQFLPQIVDQAFKNSGQYCYRVSRIYVQDGIYSQFLDAFVNRASRLYPGSALHPRTRMGPLNNRDVLERVQEQVSIAVQGGARLLLGGSRPRGVEKGFFFLPTVLEVDLGTSVTQDEIFGPVVIISRFLDLDEAVRQANGTPYGLGAYLFTRDLGKALEYSRELEVGSLWINRVHQAYQEAPFGGVKESGLGREKSHFGIQEFTELKTIYLGY